MTISPLDPAHYWRQICRVTDRLVVTGDLPEHHGAARRQLDSWVDAGVTVIVDVRGEWSDERFVAEHHPQLTYIYAPTHDDGGRQSSDWFGCTVDRILERIADDPAAVVLIHCHMGVNRAPSLAVALLLELGYSSTEALEAIRAARPIAGIIYADDAVAWFHERHESPSSIRRSDVQATRKWLADNPVDVAWVVSRIRLAELDPSDAA